MINDFYYAEGNIYMKLQQLEKDKDVIASSTAGQYENKKTLLESVLPKPKSLEDISISPNHEFVHKFDLENHRKVCFNQISRKMNPL